MKQVPEPVSPRYRSRVPECHTATGANVESMYRDRTFFVGNFVGNPWAEANFALASQE